MNREIRQSGITTTLPAINPLLDSIRDNKNYLHIIPYLDFLSSKCVFNKSTRKYNVVLRNGYIHEETSRNNAITRLTIEYSSTQIPHTTNPMTSDHISAYRNFINPVCGFMPAPLCETVISWNGNNYINVFEDNAIQSHDITDLDIEVFNNYCGEISRIFGIAGLDYEKFISIVVDGNFPARMANIPSNEEMLHFFFSWISAIYNRPGIKLNTIPYLISSGSQVFVNIMCRLLGNSEISWDCRNTNPSRLLVGCEVKSHQGLLDSIIDHPTIRIDNKNPYDYEIPNITNTLLFANEHRAIHYHGSNLVVIKGVLDNNSNLSSDYELIDKMAEIFAKIIPFIKVDYQVVNGGDNFYTSRDMDTTVSLVERFFCDYTVPFFEIDGKSHRKTTVYRLQKLFDDWLERKMADGRVFPRTRSFKQEIHQLAREERYVFKDNSYNVHYTEDFYNSFIAYHEKRSR